ncbi:hypothetical protein [Stagnimonas aquatica]|nr:hypothetical protein [Stagnimonas aquatica]
MSHNNHSTAPFATLGSPRSARGPSTLLAAHFNARARIAGFPALKAA